MGSLRAELGAEPVSFSAICPGFVDTPIRERALEIHKDADVQRPRGMSADRCGELLVRAIERRKREVVIPLSLRLALWLDRVAPSLFDRVIRAKVPMPES